MDIRPIPNDDFMQLAQLTVEMYSEMSDQVNPFQAVNMLMATINNGPNFTAIGLYDSEVLMGFVTGYEPSKGLFQFTGIHLVVKSTEWTKKLIEHCFALVEANGYKFWEADATGDNMASILEKYGAVEVYTRYRKEISNG